MLDADIDSRLSGELFFAADRAGDRQGLHDRETEPADPTAGPLNDLLIAARRLALAVKGGPGLTPRAKAELDQARHLLEALGAAIANQDLEIDALMVADDGTWFQTQTGRVDVARRGAVRRILVGLSKARIENPTKALNVDELFEVGWPGEKIPYESQVRRVYTAIWTLRTLGLEGLLLTRDEGYLLDPKKAVRLAA